MKLNKLGMLGIVTLLSVGCAAVVSSNQPSAMAQSTMQEDPMMKPPSPSMNMPGDSMMKPPAMTPGSFMAGKHPTQGMAHIVTEKGKRYLEFDQTFSTQSDRNLVVILYRSDAPPMSGIQARDYVSLGALKKVSGAQRYAIPDNVMLENYRSVAIWSRKSNATFGYAILGAGGNMGGHM